MLLSSVYVSLWECGWELPFVLFNRIGFRNGSSVCDSGCGAFLSLYCCEVKEAQRKRACTLSKVFPSETG